MPTERMCPCGCGKTRSDAIRAMMAGPAALNFEQADALLDKNFPAGQGNNDE
ncbi:hypothetical protein [Mycobacteroides chelonae]|uniref:hypothetical protein n=1 Tax=Mycobacteroides chelonae TaxID=1774 RepID=UPI0013F4EB81|nr:hypothetical protein [Mycobacteroides chelonae]